MTQMATKNDPTLGLTHAVLPKVVTPEVAPSLPVQGASRALDGVRFPRILEGAGVAEVAASPGQSGGGLLSRISSTLGSIMNAIPGVSETINTLGTNLSKLSSGLRHASPTETLSGVLGTACAVVGAVYAVPGAVVSTAGASLFGLGASLLQSPNTFAKIGGGVLMGLGIAGMIGGGVLGMYGSFITNLPEHASSLAGSVRSLFSTGRLLLSK